MFQLKQSKMHMQSWKLFNIEVPTTLNALWVTQLKLSNIISVYLKVYL